jgi:hypothetical protein
MKIRALNLPALPLPKALLLTLLTAGTLLIAALSMHESVAANPGKTSTNEAPEVAPLDPLAMKLAPGQWREYRFTGGATAGSIVRWTWLETEQQEGETLQWLETRMEQNEKVLISRILGSLDDPTAVPLRVIMQTDGMPPREMPEEMRQMAAPALKRNLLNPPTRLGEPKTVQVPAGEFVTTVYESRVGGDVSLTYYSTDLPGMISYEATAGGMVLVAFGNDGSSAINGEIIPYTPLPQGVRPGAASEAGGQ